MKQTKSESGGNVLTVSPDVLSGLSKTGATATFNVRSNVSWVAASSESWCTISPSSGSGSGDTIVETAVTVTVSANSGPQRTATITVSGTDVTAKTVSVQQYGESTQHSLNIYPESLTLDHTYHSETFTYDSTDNWQADSPVSWCYFGSGETHINGYSGSGTFIVNLIANDTGTNRSCTLSFQSDFVTKQVNVLQYAEGGGGNYLRTNVTYITLDSNAQSSNVSVESNVAWVADVLADGETRTLSVDQTSIDKDSNSGTASVTITTDTVWIAESNREWLTVSPVSGTSGSTALTLSFEENPSTTAPRTATVTIKGVGASDVAVTLTQAANPVAQHYTVGLISDIHYCITTNKKITTEAEGNEPGDYGSNSFFREDLNKLIQYFKDSGVEFVAGCGDIVTADVNDFVEFTHDYIKDFTSLDVYSGTEFLNNSNYRPFYCAMGNHDHFANYADNSLCKYINYGVADAGSRWKSITYNGTIYNCPEQLAGNNITYASSSSKSYKMTHGSDIFVFLSAYYGNTLVPNNPNYSASSKNDMSQMHPHNQLDRNDSDVQSMMQYCGKTGIFDSSTESNFNFMYYKPSDLIWLKGVVEESNNGKRVFVFSHYFFPQKAGGGNMYEVGSTELMGLTFHFLNKLNNDYPKTIWFSGHSHFSWKELAYNNTGDIHFCNKDYAIIEPTAAQNSVILTNFNGSNFYSLRDDNTKIYNRAESQTVTKSGTGWNVHIPSMSRPKAGSSQMEYCEGAIMEVFSDHVEITKLGYSTPDGVNYTSYESSLYYHSLTVQIDGSGTISGPTPGGGDTPEPGILTDICIETHIDISSNRYGKYNSHIRFEFEDGGYLHMYCGGAAEKGDATYGGRYSSKYNITSPDSSTQYGWGNLLIFVEDTIPNKFRYLCYDWGIALPDPTDSTAWIDKSEFFSESSRQKRAYFGNSTGDPVDSTNFSQAYWLAG